MRSAGIRRVFSKGDTTNWSYKLCKITEIIQYCIPSYRIYYLPELYNQILLLPTKLTFDENNQDVRKLDLIKNYNNY